MGLLRLSNICYMHIYIYVNHMLQSAVETGQIQGPINKNKSKYNNLEKWNKYLSYDNEDILMMGVVLNKHMGRKNICII